MAKTKIQELQEGRILENGSKDKILPNTVDKAVAAKWLSEYKSLDKVLNKKVACVWTYNAIKNDNSYEYLLFTFSDPSNRESFVNYITCDNDTFVSTIEEVGTTAEKKKLENYSWYTEHTLDCVKDRLIFPTVSGLYLDAVKLHPPGPNQFIIEDKDGNQYTNGDTIVFAHYPAVVTVKVNNDLDDLHSELTQKIKEQNSSSYRFWLESSSGIPAANSGNTQMYSLWQNNQGVDINLSDPNRFRYFIPNDFSIGTVNEAVDMLLKGMLKLTIQPADFPGWSNMSEYNEYLTQTKRGIVHVEQKFTYNNKPYPLASSILPITFRVVFQPVSQSPETKIFVFTTDQQTKDLKSLNHFKTTINFKGVDADPNATITISTNRTDVVKFRIADTDDEFAETLSTITGAQLEEGITLEVEPASFSTDWKGNKLPYDASVCNESTSIVCTYSLDNVTTTCAHTLNVIVTQEDVDAYNPLGLEFTTNVVKNGIKRYVYLDGTVRGLLTDATIKAVQLVYFTRGDITQYTKSPIEVSYSANISSSEHIDASLLESILGSNHTQTINLSVEELEATGRVIVVYDIPSTVNGKNVVRGSVILNSTMFTRGTVKLPYDFTADYSDEQAASGLVNDWLERAGLLELISANTPQEQKLINGVLGDNDGTVNNGQLSLVTDMDTGALSDLPSVADVSWFRYMTHLTKIPDGCFANDTSLKDIIIPNNIVRIGNGAFFNTGLEEIVIPDSVTDIGSYAFGSCNYLETVDLGKGITWVRVDVFGINDNCSENIKDVYLRSTEGVSIQLIMGGGLKKMFKEGMEVTLHVPSELVQTYENSCWTDPACVNNPNDITIVAIEE